MPVRERRGWAPIMVRAAEIVRSYETGVTLRQLYYRLVAEGLLENTLSHYSRLARLTAEARRNGGFPPLVDLGRGVERPLTFSGPREARRWLTERYRRDRTGGQPWSVWLGVEKATLTGLLASWFGDLGVPRVALRGYSSQTLVDDVVNEVRGAREGARSSVLIYCGDLDPSGVDIERDFRERTGCFDEVVRVAVTQPQIADLGLSVVPAKPGDSRGRGTGVKVQVEVEAIDPAQLRAMIQAAIDRYWDPDAYAAVRQKEDQERGSLAP